MKNYNLQCTDCNGYFKCETAHGYYHLYVDPQIQKADVILCEGCGYNQWTRHVKKNKNPNKAYGKNMAEFKLVQADAIELSEFEAILNKQIMQENVW